jgi:hypothetical protein
VWPWVLMLAHVIVARINCLFIWASTQSPMIYNGILITSSFPSCTSFYIDLVDWHKLPSTTTWTSIFSSRGLIITTIIHGFSSGPIWLPFPFWLRIWSIWLKTVSG